MLPIGGQRPLLSGATSDQGTNCSISPRTCYTTACHTCLPPRGAWPTSAGPCPGPRISSHVRCPRLACPLPPGARSARPDFSSLQLGLRHAGLQPTAPRAPGPVSPRGCRVGLGRPSELVKVSHTRARRRAPPRSRRVTAGRLARCPRSPPPRCLVCLPVPRQEATSRLPPLALATAPPCWPPASRSLPLACAPSRPSPRVSVQAPRDKGVCGVLVRFGVVVVLTV